MNKQEARKHFRELRNLMSENECEEKSKQIAENFLVNIDLKDCSFMHVFLPMAHKKEVDTFILIAITREQYPNIQIVVPVVDVVANTMRALLLTEDSILVPNAMKILEPHLSAQELAAEKIDIVVLPLLAVDSEGHRVGYGKGFYDKFLATCSPSVQKIGLSFFPPIQKISDTAEHDIALNACITPTGIWYFAKA